MAITIIFGLLFATVLTLGGYFSAEAYAGRGYRPAAMIADLATATVAALVPDGFEVRIGDENIAPVDCERGERPSPSASAPETMLRWCP